MNRVYFSEIVKKIVKEHIIATSDTAKSLLKFFEYPHIGYPDIPYTINQFKLIASENGLLVTAKYEDPEYHGWYSVKYNEHSLFSIIDFETMNGVGRHIEIDVIDNKFSNDCQYTIEDPYLKGYNVLIQKRETKTTFTNI
jgi:hypothetical protein